MQSFESALFLAGYKVVTSESLGKVVQARRHKKKRINKKWRKRYGFKSIPDGNKFIVCEGMQTVFMHPVTWSKIKDRYMK